MRNDSMQVLKEVSDYDTDEGLVWAAMIEVEARRGLQEVPQLCELLDFSSSIFDVEGGVDLVLSLCQQDRHVFSFHKTC